MMIPPLIDLFHWADRNWAKLVIVLGLASWLAVLSFPDNKVKIVYCNAGQGDETLIQSGFIQILIDGSRPGRALSCLQKHVPFFDRQIELMVVSHPQTDHFGGLSDVIKKYRVMSFVYNGIKGDSREWEEFSKLVLAEGAEIEAVAAGDEVRVGGMKLRVLWPEKSRLSVLGRQLSDTGSSVNQFSDSQTDKPTTGKPETENRKLKTDNRVLGVSSPDDLNSGAVVMDFNYGEFDALFTGDIGEEEEQEMLKGLASKGLTFLTQGETLGSIDVLKVAHHGSKYSSSLDFLKAVRPALAVIEVGKNSYGHPTAETLARLKEAGARILRTDQDGEVVVTTNGKSFNVSSSRNRN
jgi:beta-lactamase superfamily II metal-dependent hydrolase